MNMPLARSEDPGSLFDTAVAAMNAGDYRAMAACCDPASLRVFRAEFLPRLTPPASVTQSASELLVTTPGMSPEMAEYHVAGMRGASDPVSWLKGMLPHVSSLDEAMSLSPIDLFAAAIEGRGLNFAIPHALEFFRAQGKVLTDEQTAYLLALPCTTLDCTVLGIVPDGDRLAHIIFRHRHNWPHTPQDADGGESESSEHWSTEAQTARRQPDNSWLLVAGDQFLGTGASGFAIGFGGDSDDAE